MRVIEYIVFQGVYDLEHAIINNKEIILDYEDEDGETESEPIVDKSAL